MSEIPENLKLALHAFRRAVLNGFLSGEAYGSACSGRANLEAQ